MTGSAGRRWGPRRLAAGGPGLGQGGPPARVWQQGAQGRGREGPLREWHLKGKVCTRRASGDGIPTSRAARITQDPGSLWGDLCLGSEALGSAGGTSWSQPSLHLEKAVVGPSCRKRRETHWFPEDCQRNQGHARAGRSRQFVQAEAAASKNTGSGGRTSSGGVLSGQCSHLS